MSVDGSGLQERDGDAAVDGPAVQDAPKSTRPQGRLTRRLVAGGAVVVLVGGGWAGWALDAGQDRVHATAVERWRADRARLSVAVAAAEGLREQMVAAGVAEDDVAALDEAIAVVTGVDVTIAGDLTRSGDVARVDEIAGDLDVVLDALGQAVETGGSVLLARVQTVRAEALTALQARIDAAQATLDGSDGQVADPVVRDQLAAVLTVARAAAAQARGADVAAVQADTAALSEALESLTGAHDAVVAAHAAWQEAEAQRVAAEQAAAAAAVAAQTSARSGGSASTSSGGDRGSSAATTGGSSSSGKKPSTGSGGGTGGGGGYWVESGSDTWCGTGDTSGAEGTGGWC